MAIIGDGYKNGYNTCSCDGLIIIRLHKWRGVHSNGRPVVKDLTRTGPRPDCRYMKYLHLCSMLVSGNNGQKSTKCVGMDFFESCCSRLRSIPPPSPCLHSARLSDSMFSIFYYQLCSFLFKTVHLWFDTWGASSVDPYSADCAPKYLL